MIIQNTLFEIKIFQEGKFLLPSSFLFALIIVSVRYTCESGVHRRFFYSRITIFELTKHDYGHH